MEKERVIRLRILNEPVHSTQDIHLSRLAHRILLVIGKDDHVLPSIAKALVQIGGHILNIVDTATQLALLSKVVDSDQ